MAPPTAPQTKPPKVPPTHSTHGVQPRCPRFNSKSLHSNSACSSHEAHTAAFRFLQARPRYFRKRINDSVEKIHRTRVTVAVQENLSECRSVCINLHLENGAEVPHQRHKDSKSQTDNSRVIRGAILQERDAEIAPNISVKLRVTPLNQALREVRILHHVQN